MGEIPSPTNESGYRPLAIALDSPKIEPRLNTSDDDLDDESKTRAHNLDSSTSTEIIRKIDDGGDQVSLDAVQRKVLLYMVEAGLSDIERIGAIHGDRGEIIEAVRELDKEGLLALDGSRVVITSQGRIRGA